MKKILTLFSSVCLFTAVYSQSSFTWMDQDNGFADVTNTTLDFYVNSDDQVIKELEVKNTAGTNKSTKIRRTWLSPVGLTLPDQDTLEVCWKNCDQPVWTSVQLTSGSLTIVAGDTASFSGSGYGFHSTYSPCDAAGTRTVRYTVYDINNTADSSSVTFNYHVTAVGMNESTLKLFTISNAFPNPSATSATIKYDFPVAAKSTIKLYNAVGGLVKEIKISDASGKVTIDTDRLADGVYFYSLIVNDKVTTTKKLIVSH
jgi:hypothetical protein